jgi:hypothetical protein
MCHGDESHLINPADRLIVRQIPPPSPPPPSSTTPALPQRAGEGAADAAGPVPDLEIGFADSAFARAAHSAASMLGGAPAIARRTAEEAATAGWGAVLGSIAPSGKRCVFGTRRPQ